MVQVWYLHDAATANAGTLPNSEHSTLTSGGTPPSGSTAQRSMDGTIGTGQVSAAGTTLASTTAQAMLFRMFESAPLAAAVIAAGTWQLHLGASESNAQSNFQPACCVYAWRPSTGAVVGTFLDHPANATEPGTSETAVSVTTLSGSAVTVANGDILVCELWRASVAQGAATARTNTVYYDGTAQDSATTNAAYLRSPLDIAILVPVSVTIPVTPVMAVLVPAVPGKLRLGRFVPGAATGLSGGNAPAVTAVFPAATAVVAHDAAITPAALAVTTTRPPPALIHDAAVTPAALAVTTTRPLPALPHGATAAPASPAATGAVVFSAAGSSVSITLIADNVIALSTAVPVPVITTIAGTSANIAAATLAVTTTRPAPVARQDQAITQAALAVTASVPAPVVRQDRTAAPAAVTVATTRPAPVVRQDRTLLILSRSLIFAQPPPSISTTNPVDTTAAWAVTAGDLGGGTGSWVNAGEADGVPDLACATWTAP